LEIKFMLKIDVDSPGKKVLMLGNEAIARGAIDSANIYLSIHF